MLTEDQQLIQTAPLTIPVASRVHHEEKDGYQQVEFQWNNGNWQYTARWHSALPGAKIITYPSWQVERVHPGLGYGPDHHPRLQQSLSSQGQWIDTEKVHQAAWRLGHGKGQRADEKLILATHFHMN
ncbi:hypothetical protein [Limosilactobacillus sp.]|uniref:hypothetical protein n=1 Tax=Limosilactobacillus sp. TaxID=2773925 RepID=UPI00345EB0DE